MGQPVNSKYPMGNGPTGGDSSFLHLRAVLAGAEPNAVHQPRALRTIAVRFFALAAYVTVEAAVTVLIG